MSILNKILYIGKAYKFRQLFGPDGLEFFKSSQSKVEEMKGFNLKGLKNKVYLRTNTSDFDTFFHIFMYEQYNYEYPANFNPKVILDCGANIGLAAIYFANRYPDARIIAVEPEFSNFQILKLNAKGYPNITCLQNGIWDKSANLEVVDIGAGKWGFITKEVEVKNEFTIQAIAINDIMDKNNVPYFDIVKMDIEGSEKQVFSSNYEKWLSKTKMIIIEFHDKMLPGTSKAFFKAISTFDYCIAARGENIYCELP